MPTISQQLTAINLRYGTSSKSLKVLSYANLVAKAIHLSGQPLKNKEIAQKIVEILGIRSIDQSLIDEGVEELKDKNDIYKTKKDKWNLSKDASKKISEGIKQTSDLIDGVLKRNFPQSIEQDTLVDWFNVAATDFFGYNGEEWVKSICLNLSQNPKVKTTDELLKKSIEAHKLTVHTNALIDGFQGFLASSNKDDQKALMHFGFAMLSAKLVATDVGADPITLEQLKDSTFIVDTNFIFPLQLEAHRFADSFMELGKALKEINAKVVYINETKEEHKRVLNGRKGSVLKLIKEYPLEVTIDAKDSFIATASGRACKNINDFETFFEELKNLPKEVPYGPTLDFFDDKKIEELAQKAKTDQKLKKSIQEWRIKLRPYWDKRPKSESALNHDSALITVQENEAKNGKIYVLTLDRSLQVCASERIGRHSMPPAIYLEGLIQVLAANNGGPNFDVTNYAPLLSAILLKRCAPPEDTYTPEDLHWLFSIQKNVAKFAPAKIKQIALEIAKARLSGKKADDKGLRRMVDRFYQEEIKEIAKSVRDTEDVAVQAMTEAENERNLRKETEKELSVYHKKEAKRKITKSFILQLFWRVPATIIISVIVFKLTSLLLATRTEKTLDGFILSNLDTILAIISILGFSFALLKKPILKYRDDVKKL